MPTGKWNWSTHAITPPSTTSLFLCKSCDWSSTSFDWMSLLVEHQSYLVRAVTKTFGRGAPLFDDETYSSLYDLVSGMHRRATNCFASLKRTKHVIPSFSLVMEKWSSGRRRAALFTGSENRLSLVDGMMAVFEHSTPKQAEKCSPSTMLIIAVWQRSPWRTIVVVSSVVVAKEWSVSGKSMLTRANFSPRWKSTRTPWSPFASINRTPNVSLLRWTGRASSGIWSKTSDELRSPLNGEIRFRRFVRNQVLFENTLFQCVAYHPEEYHIITGGTDRKIAYWEATNGAQIRELEASKSGTINGLDIDSAGNYFVTVSADKLVKVSDRFHSLFSFSWLIFSYGVITKVTFIALVLVMAAKWRRLKSVRIHNISSLLVPMEVSSDGNSPKPLSKRNASPKRNKESNPKNNCRLTTFSSRFFFWLLSFSLNVYEKYKGAPGKGRSI